jgi:DNA-binding GntR family transcriptional regulator
MEDVPKRESDPVNAAADAEDFFPSALTSDRIIAGRNLQVSPRRVYSLLRSSIREGALNIDEHLVEEILIRTMATSRNAVREALQMLAADGLVVRRPRIGTAVVGRITALDLVDLALDREIEIVLSDRQTVPSTSYMRERLQTNAEKLLMTEALMYANGEPIALSVDYVEAGMDARFPDWTRVNGLGLVDGFEHVRGVRFGSIDIVLETTNADARTARLLGMPTGAATMVRETLTSDEDGVPRILGFAHFRGDRTALTLRMTRDELVGPQPDSA